MSTVELRDDQWSKSLQFLRSCSDVYVGQEFHCRRFIEAILWMARSGAQWRLLPEHYGNWNSVYKRFSRWCDKGIWERIHQYFAHDPNMENLLIDSTVIRAHPCAAGASKKGWQDAQALGRSRGRFSTKVHVSVDALGNPLRFELTAGQVHDITQAKSLIADYSCEYVIADKAYDSDDFHQLSLLVGQFRSFRHVHVARYCANTISIFTKSANLWSASLTRSSTTGAASHDLTSCPRAIWAF